MQQSFTAKLLSIVLLASFTLPAAHANDLSIAPSPATSEPAPDATAMEGQRLGPAEFDYQFEDVEIVKLDLWERIRKGFAIPDLNNPLVATNTTWYSSRPEYIQRTTQRASRYLFHVVQELEKRQMPTEPLESFSGSMGITRRGKYTEVLRSSASTSRASFGLT